MGRQLLLFDSDTMLPVETGRIISHWQKKKMYKQHWNEAQFIEFTKDLGCHQR